MRPLTRGQNHAAERRPLGREEPTARSFADQATFAKYHLNLPSTRRRVRHISEQSTSSKESFSHEAAETMDILPAVVSTQIRLGYPGILSSASASMRSDVQTSGHQRRVHCQ